ncbi:YbaB/EbfC family nucleoid-associated protein [Rhodococcus sp. D2-41]|uniref:YbaB/EbfC family nucleoid-associated protein n=1 Tax=Speluncibacter jeojiensis TaxID=2710754 RepID=A0A9X4LZD2_9ACTN|nr:YbaB/EbfC family nucleoid-associated protein [Rhodococcus sp. D2-41]MDG3011850.1 YbaB/EbfC family nucleoid-associated protein [Rhodococcus sp. D2-41]MDG3013302.1 YbaB/EbfC family nucleoid-associated protein [Corynebacteriales bacterium D3-21]
MTLPFDGQHADEIYADVRRRLAQVDRLRGTALAQTASARSADGLVTVWVNASGVLTKTQISPAARERLSMGALAKTITALTQDAAQQVRAAVEAQTAQIHQAAGTDDRVEQLLGTIPEASALLRGSDAPPLTPPDGAPRDPAPVRQQAAPVVVQDFDDEDDFPRRRSWTSTSW